MILHRIFNLKKVLLKEKIKDAAAVPSEVC